MAQDKRGRRRSRKDGGGAKNGGASVGEVGKELVPALGGSGAALGGAALAGPPGVLLGPVVSVALKRLLAHVDTVFRDSESEFVARRMGPAERERVAHAYRRAVESIVERLEAGEGLRDDGFFDQPFGEYQRTSAREALDGVLVKAKDAYEQRKAERIGDLYGFIAVSPDIAPAHANYLVELVGRLTYQQLLLLGVFAQEDRSALPDWTTTGLFTRQEMGLVAAIGDLGRQELIVRDDNRAVTTFSDVNPRQLRTVLNGGLLHEALKLNEAEPEDWEETLDAMRRLGVVDANEDSTRVEGVVPRGSPPDVTRVELGHRVVDLPARVLRLSDEAE